MQTAGVIQNYALFGAVAEMRYTEPVVTLDVDVLVALPATEGIDALAGIYQFCTKKGYSPAGEAVLVGAWPVQFLPAFNTLTREAMENADTADFDGVALRVVRPDYLAVIALSVGRVKDHERVLNLLESKCTNREEVGSLAARYGMSEAWSRFAKRFLDA